MDAPQLILSVVGGGGVMVTVGIAIGRSLTTSRDIEALDGKFHKLSNKMQPYPERPDDVYVRKDAIQPKLDAIDASLKRIEAHQEMMAQRFMNGGAGA